MNKRIDLAVKQNISWCAAVCGSHGIRLNPGEHIWWLSSEAPALYPDAITSSIAATPEELIGRIGDKTAASVKDSYASLHLATHGFRVLFEAQWIYLPPNEKHEAVKAPWHAVSDVQRLRAWNAANGTEGIIKPELLADDRVRIFMRENAEGISGFIASSDEASVGVSNVFAPEALLNEIWHDIEAVAAEVFPDLPLVGYESGDALAAALAAGWQAIGPLRVWIRGN